MVYRIAALKIICYPLGQYIDYAVRRKQRRKRKIIDKCSARWEKRLPRARSNCSNGMIVIHHSAQAEAPFFTRLPAEIRQLIYSYALCGNELRISVAEDQFENKPFELMCPAAQSLLGFPTSCKLAYMEVARLIYASNTFSFQDLSAFLCFERLSPAHYFHAIRTIHLRWPGAWYAKYYAAGVAPSSVKAWRSCWREIAEMKGLQSITVDMIVGCSEHEEELFEPLMSIARTVRLHVNVAWFSHEAKQWPFTVSRGVQILA